MPVKFGFRIFDLKWRDNNDTLFDKETTKVLDLDHIVSYSEYILYL